MLTIRTDRRIRVNSEKTVMKNKSGCENVSLQPTNEHKEGDPTGRLLYVIGNETASAERTVGFGVFAITHGMKWRCTWQNAPWVLAFLQLPTVENRY